MYQTVGHTAIDVLLFIYNELQAIAQAMELPLLRFAITGKCVDSELAYNPQKGDEVEDLYAALKATKVNVSLLFYRRNGSLRLRACLRVRFYQTTSAFAWRMCMPFFSL